MATERNRRARRRLPPRGRGTVVCRRGGLDLGPNLAVELLEVAETGACVSLRGRLPAGQEVCLTFESPCSGQRIRRLANVVWCRLAADGASVTGFRFQKPLRYADLDHLAKL
jgi:hypothetical protein